jgi:hypothetical protein
MKIKTSNLIDIQLDWAVTKCEGHDWFLTTPGNYLCVWKLCSLTGEQEGSVSYCPSTDGAQSVPIIEREKINTRFDPDSNAKQAWEASNEYDFFEAVFGPTQLIAAMRCYVASKLGDEVEIPDELC